MADHGNITTPDAADLNTAARRYCASQGWALSDGSYPIRPPDNHGRRDLAKAVLAVGRGNTSTATVKAHIIKTRAGTECGGSAALLVAHHQLRECMMADPKPVTMKNAAPALLPPKVIPAKHATVRRSVAASAAYANKQHRSK